MGLNIRQTLLVAFNRSCAAFWSAWHRATRKHRRRRQKARNWVL